MSTEADIVERLKRSQIGIWNHTRDEVIVEAIAEIEHLRLSFQSACQEIAVAIAERDAAAQEIERWKNVARIEAEGRQRMLELGQQAHDRAFAAARDMRERCAVLIESGAGMADLIDQQELDQQAAYIRALPDTPAVKP